MSRNHTLIPTTFLVLLSSTISLFGQQINVLGRNNQNGIPSISELPSPQGTMDEAWNREDQFSYTNENYTNTCDFCATPPSRGNSNGSSEDAKILVLQYLKADGIRVETSGGGDDVNGDYGGGGSLVFDYDIMFMKYHQSGGVKSTSANNIVGDGNSAEFDFEYSPRVSLGYELCNGLGYRLNYWYYDETAATDNEGFVSIDTYTFDAEIYRRIDLSDDTSLEFSGGYRHVDFEQRDDSGLDWGFTNYGGTISTELSHQVTCNSRIFIRNRLSIVMGDVGLTDEGDTEDSPGSGIDHETTMIELALGWESTRCMCNGLTLVYGFSGHWSQWSDVTVAADSYDGAYLTDAGFGGFAFRLGVER